MISLTNEEIRELPGYANTTGADPISSDWRLRPQTIAKAQLKKVADLLKACDGELVSRKEGPFMATFEMLATDYQALLEEVK